MTVLLGRFLLRRLSHRPMYRSANRAHIPLWRLSPNDDLSAPNSSHSLALGTHLTLARSRDRRSASDRRARGRGRGAALAPREPGNPNASLACHTGGQCAMTTIGFPGIVKTNDRERTRTGRIHLIGCPVKNGTAGAGMCSFDRSIDLSSRLLL